ncbi:MAG: hypothetical protein A3B13_02450 [Candidatus Liptonbacteria bacterium RIFCSPLOWO2_01_FULL_45_15]|uniref:Uncharacterized protein n=2 Tax=Bacteria candidate phyla TaxID=1783234 RepID=A0A1F5NTE9_9BACT|nr:MAG: hypothetical protein A2720_03195 [Candidatus Doudnabacteria bacterium RIFCSPHIGHO2_01_FULL_46_24]OGY98926.1 MAG: hypothetical protein A3B13_02450 [Candidatus Liptonbacteria bacterium RIFCSPLOWO2_01_FULL_45_15]
MKNLNTAILEKVNQIEKNLQSLKLEYFLRLSEEQRSRIGIYREKDIINEKKLENLDPGFGPEVRPEFEKKLKKSISSREKWST